MVSKRFGYVALVVLLLVSCRPKEVLSPSEMEDVLFDIHYAEAVLQLAGYNYGHDAATAKYYYEVLNAHGITQARFDSSLVWYTDHPTVYNKIYPKVLERIDREMDIQKERLAAERGEDIRPRNLLPDLNQVLETYKNGTQIDIMQKKVKKSDEKFAYVKNLL